MEKLTMMIPAMATTTSGKFNYWTFVCISNAEGMTGDGDLFACQSVAQKKVNLYFVGRLQSKMALRFGGDLFS